MALEEEMIQNMWKEYQVEEQEQTVIQQLYSLIEVDLTHP